MHWELSSTIENFVDRDSARANLCPTYTNSNTLMPFCVSACSTTTTPIYTTSCDNKPLYTCHKSAKNANKAFFECRGLKCPCLRKTHRDFSLETDNSSGFDSAAANSSPVHTISNTREPLCVKYWFDEPCIWHNIKYDHTKYFWFWFSRLTSMLRIRRQLKLWLKNKALEDDIVTF